MWPRWMSGAVGSRPSLTRSGRPSRAAAASLLCRPARGQRLGRVAGQEGRLGGGSEPSEGIRPNARVPASRAVARHAPPPRRERPLRRRPPPSPSASRPHERRRTPRHPARARGRRDAPGRPVRATAGPAAGRGSQAAPAADHHLPLGAARDRLDGLRDDDGRRVRPAEPREPHGVPGRAQLGAHGPPGPPARRADEQPAAASSSRTTTSRPYMRNAIIAIEDRRFYENAGVDLRGIGRALFQDVVQRRRVPGRLDDHPAVRQERARAPRTTAPSSRSCARRRSPTT